MKRIRVKSIGKRSLESNDYAVVGIVVTVLLIGLIIAVMTMIQTVYIPQWIEEKEANHMDDVSNEFAHLKYALDIQAMVNDSTTVSTSIPLGSKEIPIFSIGRSFDELRIEKDHLRITVETNNTDPPRSFTSDSIVFSSQNSYFVNQDYAYEGGAMMMYQEPSSVLFGKPSLVVHQYNYNFSFVLVNISGVQGNNAVSGYGVYPIFTEVTENNVGVYHRFENVTNITIFTSFPHAWYAAFNSTFQIWWSNYTIEEFSDRVVIRFVDDNNEYIANRFNIREVDVKAQIAFGLTD